MIATALGVGLAVRLVSHHLCLLGVFARGEHEDRLVLVDLDATTNP
ncbi:MAG: hypothetical protein HOP15_06195 [Planctomycetes bacterium]|nr:hypothetical protein [Planctomycetota bacterium]